ncbi:MAG: hypothetical protein ACLRZ2_07150 [Veillonella sp.]
MNKSDCIVFDKVTILYGTEQAVRDVSFSVPNGEVFAIVGESDLVNLPWSVPPSAC